MSESTFQREDRYIVIKRSDMEKASTDLRKSFSGQCRKLHEAMLTNGAPARSFVVVESDWPEYHLVWAMIEHRMAGKSVPDFNLWRRADELQLRLNVADQRNDDLESELRITKQALGSFKGERDDLQSELAKARDILDSIQRGDIDKQFLSYPMHRRITEILAHQSAPAAKDGSDE